MLIALVGKAIAQHWQRATCANASAWQASHSAALLVAQAEWHSAQCGVRGIKRGKWNEEKGSTAQSYAVSTETLLTHDLEQALENVRLRAAFAQAKRHAPSFIANEIATRMAEKLAVIRVPVASMALQRMPCDTASVALLQKAYPQAQGLRIAPSIAAQFKRMFQRAPAVAAAQPDAWQLPAAPVDLLWANLIAPWWPEPLELAKGWHSAVKPEGFLMFSALGPDTAQELVRAYRDCGIQPLTRSLVDMHDWGDALVHAGFSDPVMDMEKITLTYADSHKLLQELSALLPTRPLLPGLVSRKTHARFLDIFQTRKNAQGAWSLTLEVIYGHAFKVARLEKSGSTSLEELKATLPSRIKPLL
jgi:malonyl-CoA O-methyltransferase